MPPHPTPSKNCARYYTCRIGMATLWSACAAVCRVNKWFADDVLRSVKGEFLPKSDLSCQIDNICWMEWYPSITKTFLRPTLFQYRALARCWFRREKARVIITARFARALARCHCKQWVPGRLIGLGGYPGKVILTKNFTTKPHFCYELWKILGF